jgi:hypothetical protein
VSNIVKIINENIVVGEHKSVQLEEHMSPVSWTIYGVILGIVIPPIFYAVFSMPAFSFYYKFLIWLVVIFFFGWLLLRIRNTRKFLNYLGKKAYGKHIIEG